MTLPDFLTRDDLGEIVLSGHRIGLYHVVRYYNEGYTPEMLLCQYPTLPLALVHKVIAYYLEHRQEVDAYVASCAAELTRQQAAGKQLDLAALRNRLGQMQGAEHASTVREA